MCNICVLRKNSVSLERIFGDFETMTSKEIIATLAEDVKRLLAAHASSVEEVRSLRQRSNDQAAKIRSLQQQLKEAKAENARLQLGEALGATKSSPAARAQINRLLREIDQCINLVTNRE